MSLSIDSVIIAEGVTTDSRGALTIVGVGQNVALVDEFPAKRRYAVVVHAKSDAAIPAGEKIVWRISALSDEGDELATFSDVYDAKDPRYPDLPSGLVLAAQIGFVLPKPGSYRVACGVEVGEESAQAETAIYAVQKPS